MDNAEPPATGFGSPTPRLRSILEATCGATGEDFFRSLVRQLAVSLGVRYAFVTECIDPGGQRVRTRAFWSGSDFGENFEYDIAGTPCERVLASSACHYPSGVQTSFPNDRDLVNLEVESYLGVPILGASGDTLGHLAALDSKPLRPDPETEWILTIFAARAGAEIERLRAEEQLREKERRYALATAAGRVGVWDWDLESGLLYLDPNLKALLGYTDDEIPNRIDAWTQCVHPDDREAWNVTTHDYLHGRTSDYTAESRMLHRDGSVRWFLARGEAIRDASGRALRMVGTDTDVTERKRIEHTVLGVVDTISGATGAEFLSGLVEHLAKALAVRYAFVSELADPLGRRLRCISLWEANGHTDSFEYDIAGTPCEQVVGKDQASYPQAVQKLFPSHRWLKEKNVEAYVAVPLFQPGGQALGNMGVMHDSPLRNATPAMAALKVLAVRAAVELQRRRWEEERQRLEERVIHREKLKSLTVLAGGFAHDFNNLLTGVLGNVGLAQIELPPLSPAREKLQQIEKAALRAADLTQQMLTYSGRGQFVVAPVDLNELAREISRLMETVISEKADFRQRLAEVLPSVTGDAAQIRQVIMNLITNASDALDDEEGTIVLATGTVEVDGTYVERARLKEDLHQGEYVYIEVADSGIGIDSEAQRKIFDPFFSTKFLGRGLGLAAALGIVHGHRGTIEVKSERGRGTTMKVLFPAAKKGAQALTKGPGTAKDWRGSGMVLVVDDEDTIPTLARAILQPVGFKVLTAGNGREGVEVFRQHSKEIRVVLLDLTMPKMDGEAAFAKMRQIDPNVRVIFVSGHGEQEVIDRVASHGIAGFLQKPFRATELRDKLRQILEGEDR